MFEIICILILSIVIYEIMYMALWLLDYYVDITHIMDRVNLLHVIIISISIILSFLSIHNFTYELRVFENQGNKDYKYTVEIIITKDKTESYIVSESNYNHFISSGFGNINTGCVLVTDDGLVLKDIKRLKIVKKEHYPSYKTYDDSKKTTPFWDLYSLKHMISK